MLSKAHRFHGLGSLKFAYQHGRTVRGPFVSLRYVINPRRSSYRLAVVVSRKVSKSAVKRNRIRRRLYAVGRAETTKLVQPYDLLFSVFSDQLLKQPYSEMQHQVHDLLAKAGVIEAALRPPHDIVNTEGNEP